MRRLEKFILCTFIIFLIIFNYKIIINAASANIKISTDNSDVTVGEEFVVTIDIKSDDFIGDFETNLTYNSEVLEFISASSPISGGNGFLRMAAIDVFEGNTSLKMGIKFKALKAGISDIGFTGNIMIFEFETQEEMPVSSEVLTINVRNKEEASNNNYLSKLIVKPEGLDPKFKKDIFEYNLVVNEDVDSIKVNAVPEDENAKTMIIGDKHIKDGDNKLVITVKAESGKEREYTINVNRKTKEGELQANPYEEFIEGMDLIEYESNKYIMLKNKYMIIELKNKEIIPKGYIESSLTIGDIVIQVFTKENQLDSEVVLIYAMNDKGDEGFYNYHRKEKTIQKFFEVEETIKDESVYNSDKETGKDISSTLRITIIILIFIILILLVNLSILLIKGQKNNI